LQPDADLDFAGISPIEQELVHRIYLREMETMLRRLSFIATDRQGRGGRPYVRDMRQEAVARERTLLAARDTLRAWVRSDVKVAEIVARLKAEKRAEQAERRALIAQEEARLKAEKP
jgi:hypothetical protein